jgi:predicted NBD/HSP70 family sugar kinase
MTTSAGIIIGGHAAACAAVSKTGEPLCRHQPFGIVTVC